MRFVTASVKEKAATVAGWVAGTSAISLAVSAMSAHSNEMKECRRRAAAGEKMTTVRIYGSGPFHAFHEQCYGEDGRRAGDSAPIGSRAPKK